MSASTPGPEVVAWDDGDAGRPGIASGEPPTLVGREEDLHRIRDLLRRARAGTAGALVLQGEAGIGKTSLLAAATRSADVMRALEQVRDPWIGCRWPPHLT